MRFLHGEENGVVLRFHHGTRAHRVFAQAAFFSLRVCRHRHDVVKQKEIGERVDVMKEKEKHGVVKETER